MKRMLTWTIVMLAGLGLIGIYPLLPEVNGVFPALLIPVAYLVALIGAAGLYIAWTWRKERALRRRAGR